MRVTYENVLEHVKHLGFTVDSELDDGSYSLEDKNYNVFTVEIDDENLCVSVFIDGDNEHFDFDDFMKITRFGVENVLTYDTQNGKTKSRLNKLEVC